MRITKSNPRRRVCAAEEYDDRMDELEEVTAEETDLLFEAEDVAELLAEVTGESVDVTVQDDGETVDFAIGDEVYSVVSEGDEEILEACTTRRVSRTNASRAVRGKRRVAANTRMSRRSTKR